MRRLSGSIFLTLAMCVTSLLPSRAEDGTSGPVSQDPIPTVGTIIAHVHDGDPNTPISTCHHSIVVIVSDKMGAHPKTIEFNRVEPVLGINGRYAFSYKPLVDENGNGVRANGRQVFELDESSVVANPTTATSP